MQTNIQAFGGDPTKVTIFGESAGAYSIKQLLAHPPSPLNFRGAILESQGLGIVGSGPASYSQVATHFNCTDVSSQLECLREVKGEEIQAYVIAQKLGFPPTEDNTTYSKDVLPLVKSGQAADVPVFLGTNLNEARVFMAAGGVDGKHIVPDVLTLTGVNISSIEKALLDRYSSRGVDIVNGIVSR